MRTRTIRRTTGFLLLVASIVYVAYDARLWGRAAQAVDFRLHPLGEAHQPDRPGAIYTENDSYYWLTYAQRIARGETLRVRHTLADNPPNGRPVQWSQSLSWLLVILGQVRQILTHEEMVVAMERASIWLNPLLLMSLACFIAGVTFRRLGAIPAGLFAVYLVGMGNVSWNFQPLRPDHQGLQSLFGMLMLVSLIFGGAGWVRQSHGTAATNDSSEPNIWKIPAPRAAKFWFIFSGISTAFTLWISAIAASVLLFMLFGAVLLVAFTERRSPDGGVQLRPDLWRWWGWSACIGSLFFYLLEYFPHDLSIGLEVNGPPYGIAVIAMGEAICQLRKALAAPAGSRTRPLVMAALCTLITAALPLAILFGPPQWYALRDPQMLRLHHSIQEFLPMGQFFGPNVLSIFFKDVGFVPLFLLLGFALLSFTRLPQYDATALLFSLVITLGFLLIGWLQVRWMGLYGCLSAWLALVVGASCWHLIRDRLPSRWVNTVAVLVVLVLLSQPVWFAWHRVRLLSDMIYGRTVPRQLVRPVLSKRIALAFREHEGPGTRVLCEPDFAPALQYFGESAPVASYYWENMEGLHAATGFFADTGDYEEARRVARERGITHVVVQQDNQLQNVFYGIAHGRADPSAAQKTLAAQLLGSGFDLPSWLKSTPELDRIGNDVYTYGRTHIEGRCRIYRIAF